MRSYTFGHFRLDTEEAMLYRDGEPVALGPRAVAVLRVLLERHHVPVSRDTLTETAWPGLVVEENNLSVQIAALRRVLGQTSGGDRWIETLSRRGYRFVGPVVAEADNAAADLVSPPDRPSLAVLPFANMSGDPEQDYFADGMVEEIITALARIRWLFVIARNSSFAYKGQNVDVQRVGRELWVRYVVEGSVRRSGERVRIAAQLIDAGTGAHLWADGFEGSLGDVFELQDRVAAGVAAAIEPTLEAAEIRRSDARPPTELTVYDLYLQALAHYRSFEKDRLAEGLELVGQAIARDPQYGPALALAAHCHARLDLNDWTEDRETNRRTGLDLARRALRAAADDPELLARGAYLLGYFGENVDAAIGMMERALALKPGFGEGWFYSAFLRLHAGQPDIAIEHFERSRRLSPRDPLEPRRLAGIGCAHLLSRRFDEAARLLLISLEELPTYAPTYPFLAAAYAHLGRLDEARAVIVRLREITGDVGDAGRWFSRPEHRALILSGLRLAAGADRPAAAAAPPAEAERRQVTALHCELVGNGIDLEDRQERITDFRRRVSQIADRHAGTLYPRLGGETLVLFGYPTAHEHDAERAVRAGLELCAADPPIGCRVGIATGAVIVGGLAAASEVVGDPPILAARLQASAPQNAVIIDAASRRLVGGLFECREVAGEPMRGWLVLGENVGASRFEALRGPALGPLVGRDDEIGLLLRRWARARAGDGQVVLISGEAGIGKSRLAAALAERLDAEPYLRLRYFGSPHHQQSALHPFVDQLARAAGFTRDDPPAARLEKLEALLSRAAPPDEDVALLADLLSLPASPRHPPPNLVPQKKKERVLEALLRQLEGLAARQPVVGVFEDAQWADPTSRELLDLTIERIRSLPVLLIVTFRTEFTPPWTGQPQVTALSLNRLDRRDRTGLIEKIAGKAVPDEIVARIAERTDGVPLFVEELTRTVLESGLLREEPDRWVLDRALPPPAIPTTLRASLLARLDRLQSARRVAQIGAAIGRQFSYALLRTVSRLPEDELLAALERLVVSELVFQRGSPPDAIYTFKHALVQDAAHGSLLRSERRRLHAEIGEALEAHSPELVASQPEILAQHYAEAGLPEKSVGCWYKAGQGSAERSAMAEAAAQFEKGLGQLALLSDTPARQRQELEFLSALTAALRAAKGNAAPETGEAYARAVEFWERAGSPSGFLHLPYGKAYYHAFRGEFGLAERLAETLLRLSRKREDKAGMFLGHFSSGQTLMLTGRFSLSRSDLEAALGLYDPAFHGALARQTGIDPRGLAETYLGIVLFCLGYPEQALARVSTAIAETRRLAHPPSLAGCLTNGSVLFILAGETAAMAEQIDELDGIAASHGFPFWRACVAYNRGWIGVNHGEAAAGVSLLRSGVAAFRATGVEAWLPFLVGVLAAGCERAGRIDEALTRSDEALKIAETTGERWFAAELYRHRGQLLLRRGQTGAAEEFYCKALAIAREQDARLWELRAAVSLARLRRDQGRRTEARDLLAPVYGWFTEGFDTPDLREAKALLDAFSKA